jgi:hypothetical protein
MNIGSAGSIITFNGTLNSTNYNGDVGGATTMTIGETQTSGDIRIGSQQTNGDIWIGCNSGRNASGQILIGSVDTESAIVPIIIGNVNSSTTLKGANDFIASPTGPTPTAGDSSFKLATTAFISNALSLYATIASLSSYLTTAIASATYAPLTAPTFATSITLTSGNIQASSGNIIGTLLRNGANSGSISSTGVINGSALTSPSLTTATAGTLSLGTSTATGITIGASGVTTTNTGPLTSTGLITANGNVKANSVDVITTDANMNIGSSQLGGAIFIGSGKTGGFIAIGNSANTDHTVIFNPSVTFNRSATIDGTLTLKNPITLPTTSVTPASTQLGYFVEYLNGHTSVGTTSTTLASTGATIPIGKYLVIITWMCDSFTVSTSNITFSVDTTNGTSSFLFGALGASVSGYINSSVSGYASINTTSGTLTLKGIASAGTISCKNNIKLIRVG